MFGKIWKKWLKVAEVIGNIQMTIFLSIIYWTLLVVIAVPFKIFSDPLSLKQFGQAKWTTREAIADVLESMRQQG